MNHRDAPVRTMARLEEENQRPARPQKPETRITKGPFVTVGGLPLLNTVRRSRGVFAGFPVRANQQGGGGWGVRCGPALGEQSPAAVQLWKD